MKKHYYIIDGVSANMIESNLKNFKDNVKILKGINTYKIRIPLNAIESIFARFQIFIYNIRNSCKLQMYRLKGQRFRA